MNAEKLTEDFSAITEVPGMGATRDQLSRLSQRYELAAKHGAGKRVLEVACGSGMGLGYIARRATTVFGGDYTFAVLRTAMSHYGDRIPLARFDAQFLPFRDASFDLVVIFEALYYVPSAKHFALEAYRVLAPGGKVVVSTVNKDWSEFSPSAYSTTYHSIPELAALLRASGFSSLDFFGGYPVAATGKHGSAKKLISFIRRIAAKTGLMPTTLGARELLKRVFYGPLAPMPAELPEAEDGQQIEPVVTVPERATGGYKIIYCIADR